MHSTGQICKSDFSKEYLHLPLLSLLSSKSLHPVAISLQLLLNFMQFQCCHHMAAQQPCQAKAQTAQYCLAAALLGY